MVQRRKVPLRRRALARPEAKAIEEEGGSVPVYSFLGAAATTKNLVWPKMTEIYPFPVLEAKAQNQGASMFGSFWGH